MREVVLMTVLAATLCAGAGGCSDTVDEVALTADGRGVIAFTGGASTRAGEVATTDDIADFAVSGFLYDTWGDGEAVALGAALMHDRRVVRDGTSWDYAPHDYWPSSIYRRVKFYAWSPYGSGTASDAATEPPAVTFTVAHAPARQVDLLYAVTEPVNHAYYNADGTRRADGAEAEPVRLTFHHALSRITFRVKFADGVPAAYTARIDTISLYAASQGTMTFPAEVTTSTAAATCPAWDVRRDYDLASDSTIDQMPHYDHFDYTLGQSLDPALGDSTAAFYINAAGTTKRTYDTSGDPLFVIPQQMPRLEGTMSPTQLYMPVVRIKYTLFNGLTGDEYLYTHKDVSLSLAPTAEARKDDYIWLPGQSYCYTIVISTHDVTLNILPTDWIDGNGGHDTSDSSQATYIFK